jgi:hypothetical protein
MKDEYDELPSDRGMTQAPMQLTFIVEAAAFQLSGAKR